MHIILATTNVSKILQIKQLLNNESISVKTLVEAGIEGEAVEDGETLEENARKKAYYAKVRTNNDCWIIAEDTGLFIPVLGGKPGIYSARWAGETATTTDITAHCLKQLDGISERSAYFETVAVLISPQGNETIFKGRVNGILLERPRTPPQPKMPYSGLFVPDGHEKVWAEMTTEEENNISHRGKAFRSVANYLKGF